MKKSLMLICAGLVAATMGMTGCSKAARSPKAVVKMSFQQELEKAEKKIFTEEGYKEYKVAKEASDTLDINRVEKNKQGDFAVVFFSFKKDGKDVYLALPTRKTKSGDWTTANPNDLPEADKFKENMYKDSTDWEKKNGKN